MANLSLARTMRYFGIGDSNDYVVLDGGRVIGRVMLHPQAPEGQPWFWTITAMEYPSSVYNKGYSATREQAMADFKARWLPKRHIETAGGNNCGSEKRPATRFVPTGR